ncbi:hypothetical protein ACIRG5_45610 [Lentzea sp. NPDC102401]|uniref:hypothetical protein n=1 Tax=Lentzea sp. NPDC102401 TaxID=3364128 RepID=UPI0038023F30
MKTHRMSPRIQPARALTRDDIEALRSAGRMEVRFEAETGIAAVRVESASVDRRAQYYPDRGSESGLRSRTIRTDIEILGTEPGGHRQLWGISDAITTVCEAHLTPTGGLVSTATALLEEGDTLTQVWFADCAGPGLLHEANLTLDELALRINRPGHRALVFSLASYATAPTDPERLIRKHRDTV